jgi:ParB family transcriptional regulator, chromosome partitioning protein
MAKLRKVADIPKSLTSNFSEVTEVIEIPISDIDMDPRGNIRDQYDAGSLEELGRSIEKRGLLEPIGVERSTGAGGKWKLVYGFRRALAIAKFTNLPTVRAITVRSDADLPVIQLLENIQREDLTDYEIAKTLSNLKKSTGMNLEELSQEINKSLSWVKGKMAHANFLDEIEPAVPEQLATLRNLTSQQVAPLNRLGTEEKKEAIRLVAEGKGTVRNLREFSKGKKSPSSTAKNLTKTQLARVKTLKSKLSALYAEKARIEKEVQKIEKEIEKIYKKK